MVAGPVGCGVEEHPETCLCDVVITDPLPPLTELYDGDVVSEMWMGRELVDMRGYCIPWTNEKILDYLEDIVKFYDAYHEADGNIVAATSALCDMEPLLRDDNEQLLPWWGRIRHAVQFAMDNYNDSISDILDHLGVEAQEFMEAATTGKVDDEWTMERLLELDSCLMSPPVKWKRIAATFDMTMSTLKGVDKYWRTRRVRIHGSANPERDFFQKLCLETTMTSREIADAVEARFGVRYETNYATKYRQRVRKGTWQ